MEHMAHGRMRDALLGIIMFLVLAGGSYALPDVVISGISFTSENVSSGQTVYLDANITNAGDANITGQYVYVTLYMDHQTNGLASWSFYNLNAGETKAVQFSWSAYAGDHIVELRADDSYGSTYIAESNETNNKKYYVLPHVEGTATDLMLESLSWSPENFSSGSSITFNATVRNAGNQNVTSSQYSYVYFYLDSIDGGTFATRYLYADLPVNGTASFIQSWTVNTAGSHRIIARADGSQNFIE